MRKMNNLDNRIKLIERIDNDEPTEKELEDAYSYLDYCVRCGKKLLPYEPISHGFEGNCHRFGCSIFTRFISFFVYIIAKLILLLVIAPFYFLYLGIKKLKGG